MVVGIFVSINVLNSLKCTVTPSFFSINHILYWFSAFCPKTKKILNVRSFNFIAISTQIRSNFSKNAGICDFQLSFDEGNFT